MHTHSDYVTALSCLKDPHILPIHQSSMRFVERVAYYQEYDVPDVIDEGKKLGEALKDKDILIMGQHGKEMKITIILVTLFKINSEKAAQYIK